MRTILLALVAALTACSCVMADQETIYGTIQCQVMPLTNPKAVVTFTANGTTGVFSVSAPGMGGGAAYTGRTIDGGRQACAQFMPTAKKKIKPTPEAKDCSVSTVVNTYNNTDPNSSAEVTTLTFVCSGERNAVVAMMAEYMKLVLGN